MTHPAAGPLIDTLGRRFHLHPQRHPSIAWESVLARLQANASALDALDRMEASGGEPDVIGVDPTTGQFLFCDCAAESPAGRRSLCYVRPARDARKENKPEGNVIDDAAPGAPAA